MSLSVGVGVADGGVLGAVGVGATERDVERAVIRASFHCHSVERERDQQMIAPISQQYYYDNL